jgi:phage recombination protein Bet
MNPRYPVYVISKGRWESRITARALDAIGVPYRIVVESDEAPKYAAAMDPAKILIFPENNLGQGSIPVRNFVWEHALASGAARHWILDDNIQGFCRLNHNRRVPVTSGTIFAAAEDFTDRYENVAISGFHYRFFAANRQKYPPFYLNHRVYSCILIRNDLPYRWRGRYNEDTDLSLRALKDGWCTILFLAFLANKVATMTIKGGNTDELYKDDGRLKMAQSLVEQHPDVASVTWKWGRWQHHVDYSSFKRNKLKLRSDVTIPDVVQLVEPQPTDVTEPRGDAMSTEIEAMRNGDTNLFTPMDFDRDKIELIKRTICNGASDDELELFIHACKRTGLDPLVGQIHAVMRMRDNRKQMTIQTGIDGYRLIAERTKRYVPGAKPVYEYNERNELVRATASVKKLGPDNEWHVIEADAFFDEYACFTNGGKLNVMWATKPHIMLAKCAEALALRRAFPAELSGVYTSDELEQADNPTQSTTQREKPQAQQPERVEQQQQTNVVTPAAKPSTKPPEQPAATPAKVESPKVQLATPGQVLVARALVPKTKMETALVDKWFAKAGATSWETMPAALVEKCIEWMKAHPLPPEPADDDPLADLDTSSPAPVAASATKTTTVAEASDEDWDAFSDALVINAERASEVDRVAAVLTLLRKRKLSSAQLSDTLKAMEEDRFDWQSAQITNATAVA